MTTDTDIIAQMAMSAEPGFELQEDHVPLRISGFIALILGLLSVLSVLGMPLLVIPAGAIAFGLFALRKYDGPTPVGVKPAMFGLVLAVGFGSFGFCVPFMKTMTLGRQAEYFARQYLELVARGELEMALELKKDHVNRFMHNMPLKDHYAMHEPAQEMMDEFSQDGLNKTVRELGPGAVWELDRAPRVFQFYGRDHAQLVLVNNDRTKPLKVLFQMICVPDRRTGVGQWHIDVCTIQGEQLVAEKVL
jgi:hypothetical protein